MSIAAAIKGHTGCRYVVMGPIVYRLRRVTSAELHAAGHLELVGAGAGSEALRVIEQEQADERVKDQEKRERWRAHNERVEQERRQRELRDLLATPEGRDEYQHRMDAYVIASVDGAAYLRDGVEIPEHPHVGAFRILPPDVRVATYAVAFEPLRYVATPEEEDADAGRLCVYRLAPAQRELLGSVALAAQDVVGEVLPFRPGAGSGDAPAQAG